MVGRPASLSRPPAPARWRGRTLAAERHVREHQAFPNAEFPQPFGFLFSNHTMSFPRKFRSLIEASPDSVEAPDYVWLVYAVCACTPDACGWGGWMIEAAFKQSSVRHPTGTGDRLLSAVDEQRCPRCGRETYRTGVALRVEPSSDQTPVEVEGRDYDVAPIEYVD